MLQTISLFCALLMLAGCVTGAPYEWYSMLPKEDLYQRLKPSSYKGKIHAEKVTLTPGEDRDNILSEPAALRALNMALKEAGLYADKDKATYYLNAHLVKLEFPPGIHTTILSNITYTMRNAKTNKRVFQETVRVPCTVTYREQPDFMLRYGKTMTCSMGENYAHLLTVLSRK